MVFKGDSVFWKRKFVYNIIKMVKVCVNVIQNINTLRLRCLEVISFLFEMQSSTVKSRNVDILLYRAIHQARSPLLEHLDFYNF